VLAVQEFEDKWDSRIEYTFPHFVPRTLLMFAVNHLPTTSDFLSITAREAVTNQCTGLFFACMQVKM
jgi:hypothetical protein